MDQFSNNFHRHKNAITTIKNLQQIIISDSVLNHLQLSFSSIHFTTGTGFSYQFLLTLVMRVSIYRYIDI